MEKQFLLDLGLSEDLAKKVIVEHAKDIQAEQNKAAAAVEENKGLKEQLGEHDKQLEELKKSAKNNKDLTDQLSQLQADNKSKDEQWQAKLAAQNKNFKVTDALREAKAHNPKTVMNLLNLDDIKVTDEGDLKGLKEQVEAVQKSDPYLFATEEKPAQPGGVQVNFGGNPGGGNGGNEPTMAQKIAERLGANKE